MFGFQDSKGLEDVPKAVAALTGAEEQLEAMRGSSRPAAGHSEAERRAALALLCRLRFRRNLLNVSVCSLILFLYGLIDIHDSNIQTRKVIRMAWVKERRCALQTTQG